MNDRDEKFADAWESLTDSQREEIAWSGWAEHETKKDEVTRSHCVGNLPCFILNVASGFTGFLLGWWLS